MKSPALKILEDFAYELISAYDPEFYRSDLAYEWPLEITKGDPIYDIMVKYWEKIEEIEY